MRFARFRVDGARLDMASRPGSGTVMVSRGPGALFGVRPLRRRRVYELPLAEVASLVVRSIIAAEARTKARAKRAERRGRGR